MASPSEKRIRDKGVRLLRELYPAARIIHEFDICGNRIDLAAVTEDRIILAEVKSERDVLDRLPAQISRAVGIGGPVLMLLAEKWRRHNLGVSWRALPLYETDDGFGYDSYIDGPLSGPPMARLCPSSDQWDNRALMRLMLKPELLDIARPYGGKTKHDVPTLQTLAHENMTGRDLRLAVCRALRARDFGWEADDPIIPEGWDPPRRYRST